MEFSKEQLNVLREKFAQEKMSNTPKVKQNRKRIKHYEMLDEVALSRGEKYSTSSKCSGYNTKVVKRPYVLLFGFKKVYIDPKEVSRYTDFTIYYE